MSAKLEKDSPRVSIVLPTYNQAEYLPQALDSIVNQSWPDWELIIVNDGSTDETPAILERYHRQYGFTVVHQKNQKLPKALNTGFRLAKGDYLTWTSSDNLMLPNMLEVLVQSLDEHPKIGFVYADWEVIDEQDNSLGIVQTLDHNRFLLMRINYINACFLYRRQCQDKLGLYAPEFILAEDWEYWLRISRHFKMMRVPQVLYQYRTHSKSLTEAIVRLQPGGHSEGYRKLEKYLRSRPWAWYYSKLKWEWLRWRVGNEPLSIISS